MALTSIGVLGAIAPQSSPSVRSLLVAAIEKYASAYGVTTPKRMAAFLSQCAHESAGFTRFREIWGPTIAQNGYDIRTNLGNTPQRDGDGKLFMGRGMIQITGKANYRSVSRHLFGDDRLLTNPAILEQPEYAVRSALWFWSANGLNVKADTGNVTTVTKAINGGTNGLSERQRLYNSAVALITANPLVFLLGYGQKKNNSTSTLGSMWDSFVGLFK